MLLAALLVACSGDDPVELSTTSAPPTLVDVQERVLTPSCAFSACHGSEGPKRGLDLSSVDASLEHLVDVPAEEEGWVRVVPGSPDDSMLLTVLEGPVGTAQQMPPGFALDADSIALVRAWIEAGAPRGEGEAGDGGPAGEVPHPNDSGPQKEDLPPPAEGEGFQMGIDTVAGPGEEIWKCYVADLPGDGLTAVNRVESIQTQGVHHMDVMALGLLDLPIEPGMHDCDTLYDAYSEMMEEGIFLFATQNEQEALQLPENVAAVVPGDLRVMVEMHYVNPTPYEVDVWSRINAYTMPVDEVEDQIWGSAVRDSDINVPPNTDDHVEWTRCVMNRDIDLLLLSSHTHELATRVDVFTFDGENRGEMIYQNLDWHAPPLLQFPEPRFVPAGTGFEFQCHYRNETDAEVNWGFGADDEMCQIAIVHTPFDLFAVCDEVASGGGPLSSVPAR